MSRQRSKLFNRTFTVRADELRAAIIFASDDETRFVLNGVHIEVREGKQPLLISTDGRRLAAIETVAPQETPPEVSFDLTIATHFVKPLCAFAKTQSADISFDFHPQDRIIARFGGGRCYVDCEQGALIPGDFPNWRQVVPIGRREAVPHIGVNAEFLGDMAKAAKFLGVDTPIISVNLIGASSAMEVRIEARPSFYGILMPARIDEQKEWQPEFLEMVGWVNPTQPEPEPAEEAEAANG